MRKPMCERSAIYCWSNIETLLAQKLCNLARTLFLLYGSGYPTQPAETIQRVYYGVTGTGSRGMSASVSELTSDALYIIKK